MTDISRLSAGQKIRIGAGTGFPRRPWPRWDRVLAVHGNSAITEGGITLSCCNDDESKITVLKSVLKLKLYPSRRAWKILRQTNTSPAPSTTWVQSKSPWFALAMSLIGTVVAVLDPPIWPALLWAIATALLALLYARSKDWWVVWVFVGMSVFNSISLILLLR